MTDLRPHELIEPLLCKLGFTKLRKLLWWRKKEEAWNLLQLQKSDFGDQYFCNLGVWFPTLNPNPSPSVQGCHIQVRIQGVTDCSEVEESLDFENKMEDSARRFELYCALNDVEKNFFQKFDSFDAIARYLKKNSHGHFGIQRDLVEALYPST